MVRAVHVIEGGVIVQDNSLTTVILEEHSVSVAGSLVLLVKVPFLEFVAFVSRFKVDVVLSVVWVLTELSHRTIKLVLGFT